jgi:beta-lactamase class A
MRSSLGGTVTAVVTFGDELAAVGRDVAVCVFDLSGGGEVVWNADRVVQAGSAFKIAVCLEVYCQISIGDVDLSEQLRFTAERAEVTDPTVQRAVELMMRLSDNAATTALIAVAGHDRVVTRLQRLDLPHTTIGAPDTITDVERITAGLDRLVQQHGFTGWAQIYEIVHAGGYDQIRDRLEQIRVDDDALPHDQLGPTTTARELARMYTLIWRDQAGPPGACAAVREASAHQRLRRIALGFDSVPGVTMAGKGGGIPGLVLTDAGVITYPDGNRYAAAILTRARTPYAGEHATFPLIGEVAAQAVNELRSAS